ncbi:MAG: hypothetical protein RL885_16130 [Planctomycetota bacterium]
MTHWWERAEKPKCDDWSYLRDGLDPEVVEKLFRAAALLHRELSWEALPAEEATVAVTCWRFSMNGAALSFIGQAGGTKGFLQFDRPWEFLELLGDVAAAPEGKKLPLPRHLSLTFSPAAELPAEVLKEIEAHGWPIAGDDAYPVLRVCPRPGETQALSEAHIEAMETLCSALSSLNFGEQQWQAAFKGGPGIVVERAVDTYCTEEVEISLRAPLIGAIPADDLLLPLIRLAKEGIDPDAHEVLIDRLLERFLHSREGAGKLNPSWYCRTLMQFAAHSCGATIATLTPRELQEILFDIFPRKLSVEAEEAPEILEVLRDFYTFLDRDLRLPQAPACLQALRVEGIEKELEEALSDRSQFGRAKSMLMGGAGEGHDLNTQERVQAWPKSKPAKAKKDKAKDKRKRKSAKQSRRKNR